MTITFSNAKAARSSALGPMRAASIWNALPTRSVKATVTAKQEQIATVLADAAPASQISSVTPTLTVAKTKRVYVTE